MVAKKTKVNSQLRLQITLSSLILARLQFRKFGMEVFLGTQISVVHLTIMEQQRNKQLAEMFNNVSNKHHLKYTDISNRGTMPISF